jgi:hypothetical protein
MSNYIKTAAECTVKQFRACAYKGKYRVLVIDGDPTDDELEKAFELIYAEYADLSGLFITKEFDLTGYINFLETRINVVKKFVELQRLFISHFGEPHTPAFHLVKKYGHSLYWNHESPNIQLFLEKLNKIPGKEVRYELELKAKKKELLDLHAKKMNQEHSILESERNFVATIVRLKQAKFDINNNSPIEEMALAIADHREATESEKAQRQFTKRR